MILWGTTTVGFRITDSRSVHYLASLCSTRSGIFKVYLCDLCNGHFDQVNRHTIDNLSWCSYMRTSQISQLLSYLFVYTPLRLWLDLHLLFEMLLVSWNSNLYTSKYKSWQVMFSSSLFLHCTWFDWILKLYDIIRGIHFCIWF